MSVPRIKVYEAIDTERAYQIKRVTETYGSGDMDSHSIGEFVLYMQDYLAEAQHTLSRVWGPKSLEDSLHIVRKVAGLAVACMEQHGAPRRP